MMLRAGLALCLGAGPEPLEKPLPILAHRFAEGAVASAVGRRLDAVADALLGDPAEAVPMVGPMPPLDLDRVSRQARLDETMDTWSIATALHAEHAFREERAGRLLVQPFGGSSPQGGLEPPAGARSARHRSTTPEMR